MLQVNVVNHWTIHRNKESYSLRLCASSSSAQKFLPHHLSDILLYLCVCVSWGVRKESCTSDPARIRDNLTSTAPHHYCDFNLEFCDTFPGSHLFPIPTLSCMANTATDYTACQLNANFFPVSTRCPILSRSTVWLKRGLTPTTLNPSGRWLAFRPEVTSAFSSHLRGRG